ncbi:MAG: hypothetical protein JSV88_28820 [Candidatus Aminicenantes bacterium]|nr:MAG: hypothetical protein JSV88_28820 [Candidatus Aminicenantes bacterium]
MKIKWVLIIVSLMVILIYIPGCNQIENLTESSSKLIVITILGEDLEGNTDSAIIFSDVITSSGGIFNDTGTSTLTSVLQDQAQDVGSFYQDIIVDQIDVEYSRSDMPDAVPGVDIPFSFSQQVHARVAVGEIVELPFVLVQHTAKSESPLVELVNLGQEIVLKLEAKCTFYGKDVAGNRVKEVVGTVSVWCANFADED